jgi:hypothetical protein
MITLGPFSRWWHMAVTLKNVFLQKLKAIKKLQKLLAVKSLIRSCTRDTLVHITYLAMSDFGSKINSMFRLYL